MLQPNLSKALPTRPPPIMRISTISRASQALIALALVVAPLAQSRAQGITGLYNTGVDAGKVKQAVGATDTHYTVLENGGSQAIVTNNGSYVQDASSGYIWQNADGNPGNTTRTFRTTFTVASGYDPLTAFLTGQWSTDNFGADILINGASTGNVSTGFGSFTNFAVNSGFISGVNTLDFVVVDFGPPGALDVRGLEGNAALASSATPEPASMALVATGLICVGLVRRRRS